MNIRLAWAEHFSHCVELSITQGAMIFFKMENDREYYARILISSVTYRVGISMMIIWFLTHLYVSPIIENLESREVLFFRREYDGIGSFL